MTASAYKPFERLWRYAIYAYFAGVLIAAYVVDTSENRYILQFFVPAVGLGIISIGTLAIYTGLVQVGPGRWYRDENPIMYWFCVVWEFLFGFSSFLGGIFVLIRP